MTERYSITALPRDGVEVFTLNEADRTRDQIAPAFGNNCFAFRTSDAILEPVAFSQFRAKPTSYGIPILFPFPNRIRDGAFTFQGKPYTVDPPRHGFVRDKAWKVIATGATDGEGAWLRASIDAADYAGQILNQFPFPFHLEVTYRLRDSQLAMETVARNTGTEEMPVGFGIHPYFRLPGRGTIQVPARKRWELADSLPTGKLLDLDAPYDLREPRDTTGLTLDDIYTDVIADADGSVRCLLTDESAGTQTVVEFDAAQFPQVVVYTPPAPRAAICIEPNTCPTDAFNLQPRGIESNVIALGAGATVNFTVRIYSRPIA